ncbi:MAG TPA: 16S rRNA (adenine(1518)-N(6)/adenine(1519)-N(6))-dimethyltransferase RsmA [Candidatus Saccharimonadales bacterium]|nr:16S rRNA (adenine(1518)-N(6)/adenine(1519)-N(6))-dimethyltransferase RsmA [Candidatus Saccharimonadales bacterium]
MPDKSLGQHWLKDRTVLESIADMADIDSGGTVLEIGPGLGTLTSVLLGKAGRVVAVEFDAELAAKLPGQFPGKNLEVINQDVLRFDLSSLPTGYTVVANLPYYITSRIIRYLSESANPPRLAVLLVQREVAERLAAQPGDMSLLTVATQVYAEVVLGPVVGAELFTPPPKVDSQVVVLRYRGRSLLDKADDKRFFQLVKAGFAARRKKLRSSLSGGLRLEKAEVEQLLDRAGIDPNVRAQDLSIDEWLRLARL